MDLLQPQLVLQFDNQQRISKTFFLTSQSQEDLKETNCFKIYQHLKQQQKYIFLKEDYEILNSHILLTLTIDEIRGFIRSLLHIKSPIVVFSLWNNIDYKSLDGIYNPLLDDKPIKITNNPIIVDVYKGVASLGIFAFFEADEPFGSYGVERSDVFTFIEKIKKVKNRTFIKEIDTKNDHRCQIHINSATIQQFHELPTNVSINLTDRSTSYLSGVLELLNQEDPSYLRFWIPLDYNNSNTSSLSTLNRENVFSEKLDILIVKNEKCVVEDESLFESFILSNDTHNIFGDRSIMKSKYLVYLNIYISSVFINWEEYDFLFSISNQDKINIFFDRSRNTTIILTKKKLTFITHSMSTDYIKYLSHLILFIFDDAGQTENVEKDIKTGKLYYSRFCQGKRRTERVVLKDNILPNDDYILKDNGIYENKQGNQRFYDIANKTIYTCNNSIYKKIGVSKAIIYALGFCLYCCFKKIKETGLIRHCLDNTRPVIELDPYIKGLNGYKFIVDPGQMGILHGDLSNIFNSRVIRDTVDISSVSDSVRKCNKKDLKYSSIFKQEEQDLVVDFDTGRMKKKGLKIDFENTVLSVVGSLFVNEGLNYQMHPYPKFFLHESESSKTQCLEKLLAPLDNYIVLNKTGRIELAKNFTVYIADLFEEDVVDVEKIENRNGIFFTHTSVNFSNKTSDLWNDNSLDIKEIPFYFIHNNKSHLLKMINLKDGGDIIMTDISIDVKTKILSQILNTKMIRFSYEYEKYRFDDTGFYIDEQLFPIPRNTEHFLMFPIFRNNENSFGQILLDKIYKGFFDNIRCRDINLIKNTFLINIKRVVDKFNYNIQYVENSENDEIMADVISLLDGKYLLDSKYLSNL